ncbi:MAG TPA: DUF4123 domain-containing protein [Bryobacteraceae bacterium]|nr:DUF4123 domain-containing protein [Bryobacteraceae bacterium]
MASISDQVKEFLFAGGFGVFAVLDGASVPGLRLKLHQARPEHECLYRGDLEPDMAEVAPYLVRLERKAEFTEWVLTQGWGKHWGIFACAQADLHAMRQHFRRFLIVHDESGKPLYFRFYDPRVLRSYLPTCNASELAAIFGPVDSFVLEGEDPGQLLRLRQAAGALATSTEPLVEKK